MPADRLGNRLRGARNLGSLAAPVSLRDALDRRDQNDIARLQLGSRSTLTLQVSGVRPKSAIGIDLFAPKSTSGKGWQRLRRTDLGQLKLKDLRQQLNFFSRSRATAGNSTTVSLTLDAGEYYLRLYSRKNGTPYRLLASATPLTSPTQFPASGSNPSPLPGSSQPPPSGSSPPPSGTPQPTPNPPQPPLPPATPAGQTWIRQFGTSANDYAYGVAVNGSQLFVSGSTNGNLGGTNAGDRDSFVAQLNTQGSVLTFRQFGQAGADIAADVVTDSQGSYYVSGVEVGTQTNPLFGALLLPNPNAYVAKFSANEASNWQRPIDTTLNFIPGATGATISAADAASRIAIDSQGNVYVTGLRGGVPQDSGFGFGRASEAFVAKYDSSGQQDWIVELDELSGSSSGTDITIDDQGNVYISGITNATLSTNVANPLTNGDAFVAKLNSSGDKFWVETIAAPGTNLAAGVAVDSGGNVYITGDTIGDLPGQTSLGGSDAFLAKYSASGVRQWVKQFGTAQLDESQGIALDDRDRIYLVGETAGSLFGDAPLGQTDAWLARFDAAGNLLDSRLIGTAQNDEAYGVTVVNPASGAASDSPYTVYVVGQTQGLLPNSGVTQNQGGFDAWVAQYNLSPV